MGIGMRAHSLGILTRVLGDHRVRVPRARDFLCASWCGLTPGDLSSSSCLSPSSLGTRRSSSTGPSKYESCFGFIMPTHNLGAFHRVRVSHRAHGIVYEILMDEGTPRLGERRVRSPRDPEVARTWAARGWLQTRSAEAMAEPQPGTRAQPTIHGSTLPLSREPCVVLGTHALRKCIWLLPDFTELRGDRVGAG